MKSIKIFAAAIIFAALAACGGQAKAAPLNEVFTANPATVLFNVAGASIVEKVSNGVQVTTTGRDAAGNPVPAVSVYGDGNGTTFANFQAQASNNGFFRDGATNRYLSAKNAPRIDCVSGSYTQFQYVTGAVSVFDSCALFQAIKAVSN